jgi:hypothetical protein
LKCKYIIGQRKPYKTTIFNIIMIINYKLLLKRI